MEIASQSRPKLNIDDESILHEVEKENLCSHLKLSLAKLISDEGFLTFQLDTNAIKLDGNYFGELFEVQITGKSEKADKKLDLFIKSILPFESKVGIIPYKEVYLREIFVYTKLSAVIEELQTAADVPHAERYKLVTFYDTGNENALILENMRTKGFKVPERLKIPSLSFSEMALKELAKFHSLSFVMKEQRPEFFESKIKTKSILFNFNKSWQAIAENSYKNAIDSLKSEEAKEKLNEYVSSINSAAKSRYYMNVEDIKTGVFCHGDYRSQNILMREKDGVMNILPIDYQMTYYGHPVNDIMYYLAAATDREVRKNYMDHLKNIYYETMTEFLLYFDMDIRDLYPKEQYEKDFKERLEYCLLVGLRMLPFLFPPNDKIPDLKTDLRTKRVAKSDTYVKLINDLVEDFIDWGYL